MGTGIANARSVQWGQATPAQQALAGMLNRGRSAGTRRRRKKTAKKKAAPARRRRRSTGKARLKKGSAAAKRYMARLRRMRKR